MSNMTVTVAVGGSDRPIVPEKYVVYVVVPLEVESPYGPEELYTAELRAKELAYDIAGWTQRPSKPQTHCDWARPPMEVITSLTIVDGVL